jgi:ABC-type transport system involved in cytochrome c biogenesis permease subunit
MTTLSRIISAFVADIAVSLILVLVSMDVAEYWYNSHHSIPDPVERGEDIGMVIFGFYWGGIVFVVSFPSLFLFFYIISKNLFRKKE